ncbi:hypothetical protein [Marivirga sp.]|uniref:hypothetical protein n=1 Tax=Marivirga sp. TaxID=2018662 RepID=UPI0025FDB2C1|nr:hypothetical protein [Marivirga sp.]
MRLFNLENQQKLEPDLLNVEGNELRFDEGTPDETIFKIKSITNTSLILNIEESDDSQDLDGDGTADEIKIIVDLYLSK